MDNNLSTALLSKDNEDQQALPGGIDFKQIFAIEYTNGDRKSESYYMNHCQSVEHLAQLFRTNLATGLDANNKSDLEWREKIWGNNHHAPEKPNSIWEHIKDCFKDPTLQVLMVASIVSLVIGILKDGYKTGWIEGTAIFMAVFVVVSISSYMNYDKREQFLKLSRETKEKNVIVVRNGNEQEISVEHVWVGDILKLKIGDIINADGIIFGNSKAEMDESPVTGESDLLKKAPHFEMKDGKYITPLIFSGSHVEDGQGFMLVCAIGTRSFEGRNNLLLNTKNEGDDSEDGEEEETALRKKINILADMIGNLGYIMAFLIGGLMILKEAILRLYQDLPLFDAQTIDVFVNAFIIAVTVIVVAIPEGLPMAVTISLAYSVAKMKDEHNLVKHLDKSEAMGNVNNICTDKTGTLTKGEMEVIALFLETNDFRNLNDIREERLKTLVHNSIYKNITVVESRDAKGNTVLNGDMTEKALYKYLVQSNFSFEGKKSSEITLPFKSEYKYMMNIYKENNEYILYIKGAPERVAPFLKYFQVADGEVEDFEAHKAELSNKQEEYASSSIRTLCFAYKKVTENEIEDLTTKYPERDLKFFEEIAKDATFSFMVGIRDNNRPEVPNAIKTCKAAGITVRMVTGDNINTALAISKDVGIIDPSEVQDAKRVAETLKNSLKIDSATLNFGQLHQVAANCKTKEHPIALEGEVFRVISGGWTKVEDQKNRSVTIKLNNKDAFIHTVKKLRVIARASPEDKFLLVYGLKQLNNIVAVTGDGTNDAPALKQSDVGFAMGIRGTDIAKNAADVILLDDSFGSIVTACKYGRNVYDCIRKFVQFQLTTNIVAVFMTFLGGIILKDAPLNAIEMLWVNLIMDSFASLALATESPSDEWLKRKPYSKEGNILTPMMILNIVSQAIFQIVGLTIIIFYGDIIFGVPSDRELEHFVWNNVNGYHFTIFFNIFVFMQVFNSINARKLRKNDYNVFSGILGNWYYIFIQLFIVFGQILLVTFGGRAVRTQRLTVMQHLQCIAIAFLTIVVGFFVKWIPIDTTEPVAYGEDQDLPTTTKKSRTSFGYGSRGVNLYGVQLPAHLRSVDKDKKGN